MFFLGWGSIPFFVFKKIHSHWKVLLAKLRVTNKKKEMRKKNFFFFYNFKALSPSTCLSDLTKMELFGLIN